MPFVSAFVSTYTTPTRYPFSQFSSLTIASHRTSDDRRRNTSRDFTLRKSMLGAAHVENNFKYTRSPVAYEVSRNFSRLCRSFVKITAGVKRSRNRYDNRFKSYIDCRPSTPSDPLLWRGAAGGSKRFADISWLIRASLFIQLVPPP